MRHTILLLLCAILLSACGTSPGSETIQGEQVVLNHARLAKVYKQPGKVRIDILNPWDTTTILRSILVDTPVKRAAVYTATHASLLAELGALDRIGGTFDTQYIRHGQVRQAVADGRIRDLGNSNSVNIEQIMDLHPDLLMPSPYESQGGYGRLEHMGIPIMECADYMEVSPLARAEWIRIYGLLFGLENKADSLFASIESRYNTLKAQASKAGSRPRLLTERPLSGTWHVPCGGSTTGILYRDAGADYIFSHLEGSGSRALSVESVLEQAINADIWLIKSYGPLDKDMLEADAPLLRHIPAQLHVCDTRQVPFFEETPFHPEYLLENLINLFHPELDIQPQHTYFE